MAHKPTTDDHLFDCSECGKAFETLTESAVTAYCPWCGANVLLLKGNSNECNCQVCQGLYTEFP